MVPVFGLVLGIVGVGLGWLPIVGRFVALACGLAAVAAGAVGMKRAEAGVKGSGYNLAVAAVALGCASLFEGARAFGCAAAGTAVMGLFS